MQTMLFLPSSRPIILNHGAGHPKLRMIVLKTLIIPDACTSLDSSKQIVHHNEDLLSKLELLKSMRKLFSTWCRLLLKPG